RSYQQGNQNTDDERRNRMATGLDPAPALTAPPTWTPGLIAPPTWADSAVGIMMIAATAPIIESLPSIRLLLAQYLFDSLHDGHFEILFHRSNNFAPCSYFPPRPFWSPGAAIAADPARENGHAVTQPWPMVRRHRPPDQPSITVAKPARMARVWPN